MRYKILGKTSLQVSELAMGGLFVASFAGDFEQAKAAIYRALDLGVNYIDTAPGYADSEEVLGQGAGRCQAAVRPLHQARRAAAALQAAGQGLPAASLEESLRLLKRDQSTSS